MRTALIAGVVRILAALCVPSGAIAQADQEPAPLPQTVAPPGIIVTPPRLPPAMSVPGPQIPAGDQGSHACPVNDQKLELIG
jgi:hypothetical protein